VYKRQTEVQERRARLSLVRIPYRGAGEMKSDLL
jgi:hypothetical protein